MLIVLRVKLIVLREQYKMTFVPKRTHVGQGQGGTVHGWDFVRSVGWICNTWEVLLSICDSGCSF